MSVLTNAKDFQDGPTVQLPNNKIMSATITGNTPLARSLSDHAKKSHIFDGLYSASLIYLGQMCDDGT